MNEYEMVTLYHPRLDEDGVSELTTWLEERITSLGGEVVEVKPWGRRSLAFEIKKQTDAVYVQVDFKLPGDQMVELNRAMRLHEDILRQLPVRKES